MNLPYKLIAYINGIRFYPAGCAYSSTAGEHAQFTLTMPAVREWAILPERSHCAVFFTDPVANAWRLLCEGEYIGDSRQKSSIGTRYRSLAFRSTHALFETTTYCGMAGLTSGDIGQANAPQQTVATMACGVETRTAQDSAFDLVRTSLMKFVSDFSNSETRLSTFLPAFIDAVMQQTPVDAFYAVARQLSRKMFALVDDDVGKVVDFSLFTEMVSQSWGPQSLGPNTRVEDIIRSFENISFYTHVSVPSPPLYVAPGTTTGFRIPELLFIPHLYSSIPPACNVIFKDQVVDVSGSRNFLAEPTRVIAQLQAFTGANDNTPLFFMSNDVERSVSVLGQSTSKVNQTNEGAAPGTLVIHDFLSLEEYTRGVIPYMISFPLQNLSSRLVGDHTASADKATEDQFVADASKKIQNYVNHSVRHHYEVARAEHRTVTVSCSFLPYLVPGFPCLVEDDGGSFWGMVQSVTHTLMPTGQPSTTVQITHVRESYILEGRFRNAFNPVWLNSAFLPTKIDETYKKLFGANAPGAITAGEGAANHSAMVPPSVITAVGVAHTEAEIPLNAGDQINLDQLAAYVIPTPHYTIDGRRIVEPTSNTVAEKIRRTKDVQLNCLKFQFRAGTTLTQFAHFHGLPGITVGADEIRGGGAADHPDYIFSKVPPPDDLASGHPNLLFGTPFRMVFGGKNALYKSGNPFGVYTLENIPGGANITYVRQQASLTIREAIDQILTEG